MSVPKKRPYPVEDIFNSAMCTHVTLNHIQSIDPHVNPGLATATATPSMALSALTIELFLKVLHAMDHNDVPRTHDLLKLFNGLKAHTRAAIRKGWEPIEALHGGRWRQMAEEQCLVHHPGLEAGLGFGRDAFERYRYTFEPDAPGSRYYIDGLRYVLEDVILKRRPTLRQVTINPFTKRNVSPSSAL